MIDPANITNYNLTSVELEEHILFWVCAAGKNGRTAARCLDSLLKDVKGYQAPLNTIAKSGYDCLAPLLKRHGIGCYNSKARTMWELANSNLDLRTCSAEDLEKIYGIGMKTSRCFIMHSRPDTKYAGLDTHILKFLRSRGVPAPKSTPTNRKKYLELERKFLTFAEESGKMVAELDLEIWNYYSR